MDVKAGCGLAMTVIALTGCGGGDTQDAAGPVGPPPEKRLSKAEAEYVKRVDATCKEGDEISAKTRRKIDELQGRLLPRAEMGKRMAALLEESSADAIRIRNRIRRLEAPPGQKRFRRRYLAYSDRLEALSKEAREAIARGVNPNGGELRPLRMETIALNRQRASLIAKHGGFRYCG